MIVGIDEVGRGPWAGPLVVGAVVLGGKSIPGLTDSKKLTKKHREVLNEQILESCLGYGLGWVSAKEIDDIGLSAALTLATVRALVQINTPYHEIIIDGTVNFLKDTNKGKFVTTMKKADLLVPSVSAASIIAKVARDTYMADQDEQYPGYNFASHVGYGTAAHRQAIEKLDITPLHRVSFKPLLKYSYPKKPVIHDISINYTGKTTKTIGDEAEDIASQYLVANGHVLLERNWRTKFCEIDIVSQHESTVYFTEVKYRSSKDQGGGIAAITPKKLRQMKFAAELFALKHSLSDINLRLSVIEMSNQPPSVESYLKIE